MTELLRFRLVMRAADPGAAGEFLERGLGYSHAGRVALESSAADLVFRPPERLIPMVEIAAGPGHETLGFFALHSEVPNVQPFRETLGRFELIPPVLEERPAGRRLITARWPGTRYSTSVFDQAPPYWQLPDGRRFVAIGSVPDLDRAQELLEGGLGWTLCRRWEQPDGSRGIYLRIPGDSSPEVVIASEPSGEEVWQVEVEVADLDEVRQRLGSFRDATVDRDLAIRPNGERAAAVHWREGGVLMTFFHAG